MQGRRKHQIHEARTALYAAAVWLAVGSAVEAQQPNAPAPEPLAPSPTVPPAVTPADALPSALPMTPREAALEARIQQLEAIVSHLQRQSQTTPAPPAGVEGGSGLSPSEPGVNPIPGGPTGSLGPVDRRSSSRSGGLGVPGGSMPPTPLPKDGFNSPATLEDKPARVRFGPGFEIATIDDEFIWQFHDLTQVDYRGYLQGGQDGTGAVYDTFAIPRQWWIMSGHATREIGYLVSFNNGLSTVSGLDMFIDFNYDKRLQFRAGRFKTPFTYEFFVEPIQGLIVPERSIFFNNFGQNREVGIMAYGQLFNGPDFESPPKLQYAAGIFNGNRNGYIANQDSKFGSAFVNVHPFADHPRSLIENFNLGGSVFFGRNAQAAQPQQFNTVQPIAGSGTVGTPFLTLNDGYRQQGPLAFWDLHAAWFYQQLALIAEWQSGYQDYAKSLNQATLAQHIRTPVQSFYVEAGYLLTGETRTSVGVVKPSHPFSLRPAERGWGAWEVFGRYDYLDIGSDVYSFGLSNTAGNANRVWMTDAGITWHMSQYLKMFFDWNHAEFNNPVTYNFNTKATQPTANTLWWRLQLYF
jgi:phosphate-selective porin OprO/OprP